MKQVKNMKKRSVVGVFSVLVIMALVFTGCEAGLTSSGGSGEGSDTGFSFSDLYSNMNKMQEDILALQNSLQSGSSDLQNQIDANNLNLQSQVDANNLNLQSQVDANNENLQDQVDAMTERIDVLTTLMAPVGSIVAWHKNLGGVDIPAGWMECDGRAISVSGSPYKGSKTPNLNGKYGNKIEYKYGSFLRGHTKSGYFTNDTTALNGIDMRDNGAHFHSYKTYNDPDKNVGGEGGPDGFSWTDSKSVNTSEDGDHSHTLYGAGTETAPVNMTVVWIMRVI